MQTWNTKHTQLSVPWLLRPRTCAAAATCGLRRCELPAIGRVTPQKIAAIVLFCGRRSETLCDFCSGMVASPLASTVVTAILRCEVCAAENPASKPRQIADRPGGIAQRATASKIIYLIEVLRAFRGFQIEIFSSETRKAC